MDIKFDLNAIVQSVIDNATNELLFNALPDTDIKTKNMLKRFFQEMNSRGVSSQTIFECLLEANKENPE